MARGLTGASSGLGRWRRTSVALLLLVLAATRAHVAAAQDYASDVRKGAVQAVANPAAVAMKASGLGPSAPTPAAAAAVTAGSDGTAVGNNEWSVRAQMHPGLQKVFQRRWTPPRCGNWHRSYRDLHGAMLRGEQPPRFSVMVSESNGLGDRLSATVTIFLTALLQNRAFLYRWGQKDVKGVHELWATLRSPWIDWRYPMHYGPGHAPQIYPHAAYPGTANLSSLSTLPLHLIGHPDNISQHLLREDVTQLGAGYEVLEWTNNADLTIDTFSNPLLAARLSELGLKREVAVSCLFNYLFSPTYDALSIFSRRLLDKLLDDNSFVVGIQMRAGDEVWNPKNHGNYSGHLHSEVFYDCAQQLSAQAPAGKKVYWLLISDSKMLRHDAQRRYPDIVISADIVIDHVQDHAEHGQLGMHAAAGEAWLFSLADAHIISTWSYYGRIGALAADHGRLFGIDYGQQGKPHCDLNNPPSLDIVKGWGRRRLR